MPPPQVHDFRFLKIGQLRSLMPSRGQVHQVLEFLRLTTLHTPTRCLELRPLNPRVLTHSPLLIAAAIALENFTPEDPEIRRYLIASLSEIEGVDIVAPEYRGAGK
jgi:hypothetical protein